MLGGASHIIGDVQDAEVARGKNLPIAGCAGIYHPSLTFRFNVCANSIGASAKSDTYTQAEQKPKILLPDC